MCKENKYEGYMDEEDRLFYNRLLELSKEDLAKRLTYIENIEDQENENKEVIPFPAIVGILMFGIILGFALSQIIFLS